MLNVQKKQIKTIDDYRHNIQLLKYHLKKQSKTNEKLKYQEAKAKHSKHSKTQSHAPDKIYSLTETVKTVSTRLKRMGMLLGDLFRMADATYEGEINKEQFIDTAHKLKTDLDDTLFVEMFYAIDFNMNGLISEEEFSEFSLAHGGCSNSKEIRKYEKKIKSKLVSLIQQKKGSVDKFIVKFQDPIPVSKFSNQIKGLGLSQIEAIFILKVFDPSHQGKIKHKVLLSMLENVKAKTQKEQKQEEYEKGIQELCAEWRNQKLNPIDIFQEADVDGVEGVSAFELEQAFKKLMPGETNYQIKKWVSMINLNSDSEITKEQFLNSIRSFYSLGQMNKFSTDYQKRHPELKIKDGEEQSVEAIMKELSNKIEDSGMTKKQVFHSLDFNKNGEVSKEEMLDGLKEMGMKINFIGRVMSVFDRDSSGEVNLQQWLRILGEDVEMEDVPMDDIDFDDEDFQSEEAKGEKSKGLASKKKQPKKEIKKQPKKQEKKQPKKEIKTQIKKEQKKQTKKSQNIQPPAPIKKKQQKPQPKPIKKQTPPINLPKKNDFAQDQPQKKKKQQTKPKPEPKPEPIKKKQTKKIQKVQSSHSQQDNNFEQDIVDVEPAQTQLAISYKKNKKNMLNYFKKYDKSNSGNINASNFKKCLNDINSTYTEKVVSEIYNSRVQSQGFLYQQWLENISQDYAQDVQQQQQQQQQQPQSQQPSQEEQNDSNSSQIFKNTQKILNLHQQKIKKQQQDKIKHKRGLQTQMLKLLTLNVTSSKTIHTIEKQEKQENNRTKMKNYKLLNYIDEDGKLKEKRNKMLEKAKTIIKKNSGKFKDLDFLPEYKSLVQNNPNQPVQIQNAKLLKWKHYSQIFSNPQLFSGMVEPNDIKQGSLGDCYFLSALACLAQYQNLIERLFEYYDLEKGYFLIWMCIDGLWKLVELDGFFPTLADGKTPAFSRTNHEELWVLLLEKAYAKCYGCYNNIVGGVPSQAVRDLSGSPGYQIKHDKTPIEECWNLLVQANKKQHIMAAATKVEGAEHKQQGHQEGITSQGVVLGHAYSILDLHKVRKTGEKILQLRNPWGQMEWKGQWSDDSKKWKTDLQNGQIQYIGKADDGIFWMPITQYYKNFNCSSINYVHPEYYYECSVRKNVQQFAINIQAGSFEHGYFMIAQNDHRHKGLPVNTPFVLIEVNGFIMQNKKILQKFPSKRCLYQREALVKFNDMKKYPKNAEAIVLVSLAQSTDVVISFYCDRKQADFAITNDCLEFLEALAYADKANNPTLQTIPDKMQIWLSSVQGVGFLCVQCISNEKFKIKIDLNSAQNIQIIPPTMPSNVLQLKPGSQASLKGKVIDLKQGFSFNPGISFC